MLSWWHGHKGTIFQTPSLLSRFGTAVLEGDTPIAVQHIYTGNTADMVFVGFTVTDPTLTKYRAGKALKLLALETEEAIRRLGYGAVYTSFDNSALQKLYGKLGYQAGSTVLEQWKVLK